MNSANNKSVIIHEEPSQNVIDLTSSEDTPSSSPAWDTVRKPEATGSYMCPICLEPPTMTTRTKCGHVYCQECIYEALRAIRKCPLCKKKATLDKLERIFL